MKLKECKSCAERHEWAVARLSEIYAKVRAAKEAMLSQKTHGDDNAKPK